MKKLQVLSIILLLFGIWLTIFPIGSNSKIPELISILAVLAGLVCGTLSLFGKEK